jgi:hypothetical protein
MSFKYVGSKNGGSTRNLIPVTIGNSKTIAVGELVLSYKAGTLDNPVAAQPGLGIVHSIVRGDAGNLPEVRAEHTAGSANTSDLQTVTAAADNATTGKYAAMVDVSKDSLYSATVSGTLGTTNSSAVRGAKIDVDSANSDYGQLLEETATRTIGTPANFYSHGLDPEDATRLIVSLAMSEQDSVLE